MLVEEVVNVSKARIFLFVDLQEFFSDLGSGGREKKALKMTSQLVFFNWSYYFLISPETVKLAIGKPTVCIKSLNILSFS